MSSITANRRARAALSLEKAKEAYDLAGHASSVEAYGAALALGGHWRALARFQLSDQLTELEDVAEAADSNDGEPSKNNRFGKA
jgi:hypothetical protein